MRKLVEITLEGKNLEDIVKLHTKSLPNDFLTLLGEPVLYIYYSNLGELFEEYRTFQVKDGNDMGFVHYGISPRRSLVLYFLRRSTLRLIKFTIEYPLYALELLMYALMGPRMECELLFIYVNNNGNGVGSELLSYSLEQLKEEEISVKTLASTNSNVKFYQKNGFGIDKEILGRVILKKTK